MSSAPIRTVPWASTAAVAALRTNGFAVLDRLWDDEVTESLAREARELWATARPPKSGPLRRVAPSRPGVRPTLMMTGPVLEELHQDLASVARALSGQFLEPSYSAYYIYENNDEVRLHLDTDQCDLTLIAEAMGDLGPLRVHPELAGMTIDELFELEGDPTWDRESGIPVHHPRTGVTAFRGRRMPHHRPGREINGVGAIAALHFRDRYGSAALASRAPMA